MTNQISNHKSQIKNNWGLGFMIWLGFGIWDLVIGVLRIVLDFEL